MSATLSTRSLSPTKCQAGSHGKFLLLEPETLLPQLNARACFVSHQLNDHPLFDMERLLKLAQSLPSKYVRINSGAVPVNATPDQIPGTGLSIEESFARIADSNTRIMLKKIELDSDYRELLHTCLGEIEALGHPCTRAISAREGYVFLSAPNMVTPYHMDPEINFLLQIRGRKTFFVMPGDDRSILSEEDIELFYAGRHESLPFKEEKRNQAAVFEMGPGDGVHIPVNHPHWVTTSNEVTISFALTLQTAGTHRRGMLHAANHFLRRFGCKPTPFGQSAWRDFVKFQGFRAVGSLKSWLPRSRRTPAH